MVSGTGPGVRPVKESSHRLWDDPRGWDADDVGVPLKVGSDLGR